MLSKATELIRWEGFIVEFFPQTNLINLSLSLPFPPSSSLCMRVYMGGGYHVFQDDTEFTT